MLYAEIGTYCKCLVARICAITEKGEFECMLNFSNDSSEIFGKIFCKNVEYYRLGYVFGCRINSGTWFSYVLYLKGTYKADYL